jgi:hypothetical protein
MNSASCRRCIELAETAREALAVLNNPPTQCKTCTQSSIMHIAAEQFRMRLPHWWVVGGTVVVPIWVVELLKSHVELEI